MRKGRKIKTWSLLFSWLVILAHSIIPHNHAYNSQVLLHVITHSSACMHGAEEVYDEFQVQGEDKPVCMISGLLFHQLTQDNIPAPSQAPDLILPTSQIESPIVLSCQFFFRERFPGSASLRSPPSA